MKKKYIVHKIKKYYKQLDKARTLVIPSCREDDIHLFRVFYKKLKSFLHMLTVRRQVQDLVIPEKLKKAYRLAGNIRNFQLQQLTFQTTRDRAGLEYLKMLGTIIKGTKKKLLRLLSKKLIEKSRKKNISTVRGTFCFKDYRKFLEKKLNNIHEIIRSGSFNDTALHETRKELKEIFYTSSFFKDKRSEIPGQTKIQYASCKELSEKLGDFQDQCNIIRLLLPGCFPQLSIQTKMWMAQERKKRLNRKAGMRQLLITDLKTMLV